MLQLGQTMMVELLIRYQTQFTLAELATSLWSARRPSLSCSFAALAYTNILSQRQNDADFVDRIGWLRLMELLSRRGRLMENSLRIMEVPVVLATRENTVEYG